MRIVVVLASLKPRLQHVSIYCDLSVIKFRLFTGCIGLLIPETGQFKTI